ncbi:hypothetical protein [Clostridium algidicarnis]|uniref:hypothetical protein n=1 Tax=Clostridium algidicarnis TaxID=37659 RepID=UPI003FD849AF
MNNFNQFNIIKEILQFEYENKMISKGNNFPKLNINEYNLKYICILLHNKIEISEISRYFGWSQKELSDRLELLLKEELIIKKQNEYIPYLMVISLEEGKKLNDIANIIKDDYINIFEENHKSIHYSYNNSVYLNEISFEEYFIWWYHLLYSRVTDLLIEAHIIDIPNTGNFSYIVS